MSDVENTPADRVRAALDAAGRRHPKRDVVHKSVEAVDTSRVLDPLGAVDQTAVGAFVARREKASPRADLAPGADGQREAGRRFPTREQVAAEDNVRPLPRRIGKAGEAEASRRYGPPPTGGDAA
ncbi:MAG: hypothetical protein KY440_09405 [Actinobacteria bacterium]|nr:hypothetical protein [Actinomycetota bacterium]